MIVDGIEWESHSFSEKAVLCFIIEKTRILLIRKKRGLGAGKINAPGGRIEEGETPLEAAVRETREEVGLTPGNLIKMGELNFIFTNGYSLFCTVFITHTHTGTPIETDEAIPMWVEQKAIPYDEMWGDDHYWLPMILKGQCFEGFFTFEEDRLLDKKIITIKNFS